MSKHIAHALFLFASNTGELYQQHLATARMYRNVGVAVRYKAWRQHVRYRVVPLYLKQFPEVYVSSQSITAAARELADYYQRHIEEF
jgi:hypothetical protein